MENRCFVCNRLKKGASAELSVRPDIRRCTHFFIEFANLKKQDLKPALCCQDETVNRLVQSRILCTFFSNNPCLSKP